MIPGRRAADDGRRPADVQPCFLERRGSYRAPRSPVNGDVFGVSWTLFDGVVDKDPW
jgi:hypothetical protein